MLFRIQGSIEQNNNFSEFLFSYQKSVLYCYRSETGSENLGIRKVKYSFCGENVSKFDNAGKQSDNFTLQK
jgi:hypothetical protein